MWAAVRTEPDLLSSFFFWQLVFQKDIGSRRLVSPLRTTQQSENSTSRSEIIFYVSDIAGKESQRIQILMFEFDFRSSNWYMKPICSFRRFLLIKIYIYKCHIINWGSHYSSLFWGWESHLFSPRSASKSCSSNLNHCKTSSNYFGSHLGWKSLRLCNSAFKPCLQLLVVTA